MQPVDLFRIVIVVVVVAVVVVGAAAAAVDSCTHPAKCLECGWLVWFSFA